MYIAQQIKVILDLLTKKEVGFFEKLLIIIMLIYIVSPIDFIPFPVFGYNVIDDIIVVILLIKFANKTALKYDKYEKMNIDPEHFVNNVDYEVKDKEEEDNGK